jgi:hypothetical protein
MAAVILARTSLGTAGVTVLRGVSDVTTWLAYARGVVYILLERDNVGDRVLLLIGGGSVSRGPLDRPQFSARIPSALVRCLRSGGRFAGAPGSESDGPGNRPRSRHA